MEELDLKDILDLFLNKKAHILIIIVLFMIIGGIYTYAFTTPKYTSSTTLLLTGANGSNGEKDENTITTSDVTLNSKLVSTYGVVAKSKSVLEKVISNLNVDIDTEELKKNIAVTIVEDTEVIRISVTNADAELACILANEIAEVFCDKVTEHYGMDNIHILDKAEVESSPSNMHHKKDIMMFAFAGFAIAVGYVLLDNVLDSTIKSAEEIEKYFGMPVLISIPYVKSFNNEKNGGKRNGK